MGTFQVEPVGAGFLYVSPIIPYRSGFAKLSRQLDRLGPLDGSVPSVLPTLSRTIKSKAKYTRDCSAFAFFFVFMIFTLGRRRTLGLGTHLRRALPLQGVCVALRAPLCESERGPSSPGLACLADVMHVFTAPARR